MSLCLAFMPHGCKAWKKWAIRPIFRSFLQWLQAKTTHILKIWQSDFAFAEMTSTDHFTLKPMQIQLRSLFLSFWKLNLWESTRHFPYYHRCMADLGLHSSFILSLAEAHCNETVTRLWRKVSQLTVDTSLQLQGSHLSFCHIFAFFPISAGKAKLIRSVSHMHKLYASELKPQIFEQARNASCCWISYLTDFFTYIEKGPERRNMLYHVCFICAGRSWFCQSSKVLFLRDLLSEGKSPVRTEDCSQ